ncbi:unnamed protein product [Leuciscus chuanchicus]
MSRDIRGREFHIPAAFTEKQFCPNVVDRNLTQQSPLEEALVNLEPAHVGVEGNEAADEAARARLVRENVEVEVPFDRLEFRSIIKERLTQQWQHEWSKDISGRKFYDIKPLVNPGNSIILPRMDQIKLARLRLGHCGLASGLFLVGKHRDGKCQACGVQESVKHVIMFCPRYAEERRLLFIGLNVLGVDLFSVKTLMGHGPNQTERA